MIEQYAFVTVLNKATGLWVTTCPMLAPGKYAVGKTPTASVREFTTGYEDGVLNSYFIDDAADTQPLEPVEG